MSTTRYYVIQTGPDSFDLRQSLTMKTRYIIRHEHTHRMLTWSYCLSRVTACAHGLRARLVPCYIEESK